MCHLAKFASFLSQDLKTRLTSPLTHQASRGPCIHLFQHGLWLGSKARARLSDARHGQRCFKMNRPTHDPAQCSHGAGPPKRGRFDQQPEKTHLALTSIRLTHDGGVACFNKTKGRPLTDSKRPVRRTSLRDGLLPPLFTFYCTRCRVTCLAQRVLTS